jgi:O-antigen/teichoic acid export membrane protein
LLIVLGWRSAAGVVVLVNAIRTITNASYQLNGFINAGVIPELAERFGADDLSSVRDIAEKVVGLTTGANVVFTIGVVAVGVPFLSSWSNGRLTVSEFALTLFVFSATTDCVWQSMANVARAKNSHQRIMAAYLFACFAALALCFVLVKALGLTGVAVALFSTSIVVNVVTIPYVCKLLQMSIRGFASASASYCLASAARVVTSLAGMRRPSR